MRLLAADPENPDLHRLVAIALWQLERPTEAESHLHEALRIDADDNLSRALLALLRSSPIGKTSSDRDAIAALALDPDSILAWTALAQSSLGDDPGFSRQCCQRMLQLDPHCISAHIYLHHLALLDEEQEGSRRQAEQWLRDALAIEPENADLHALLGDQLITERGRKKEGRYYLEQALMLDPSSSSASTRRETLGIHSDIILKLLRLPGRICLGAITGAGRLIGKFPILIILGKFYLALVAICLVGWVIWLYMLGPVAWMYRRYAIGGEDLRARLACSRWRMVIGLVPRAAWLRRCVVVLLIPAWFFVAPQIVTLVSRLHPSFHAGNLGAAALAALLLGGLSLALWLRLRKRHRRKLLGTFPALSHK